MKRKYLIPYPYTLTILFLTLVNISFLVWFNSHINWSHYLTVLSFNTIFGVVQIADLENNGPKPCWYFPKGSCSGIKIWGNVVLEDILFVPICTSLFYLFMTLTENVPDVLRNEYLVSYGLAGVLLFTAYLYSFGGLAARNLINAYMVLPIIALMVLGFDFRSLNVTHLTLSFVFIHLVNDVWELANTKLMHWCYDKDSGLLSKKGFFFKGRLHISIFFLYPIGGFIVMNAVYNFFK